MNKAAQPQQLKTTDALIGHEREQVLNWLEDVDRHGLGLSLAELGNLLDSAPQSARMMPEYHYLRGFHDHKFLSEEIS